jgi:demethylmenaquinone methyltransferase/2-methoxy-6-polyprenyl-1,4-benzoquinol methylase
VRRERPGHVLDLATGTGDFALAARRLRPAAVIGVDVARDMLRLAARKLTRHRPGCPVRLAAGDAERLPFRPGSFDLVIAAFGVRNFDDLPTGLREAWRVLRPGGELLVLEFAEPTAPVFRQLYRLYFTRLLPLVGRLVSGHGRAYSYLPESVGGFAQGRDFLDQLERAGFIWTRAMPLSLGICWVYQGWKAHSVDEARAG